MSVTASVKGYYVKDSYYRESTGGSTTPVTATIHREFARIDVTAHQITVTFNKAFNNTPIGWIAVYRYVAQGSGYVRENVLYTHPEADWLKTTGFILDIASFEDLTDVIVEYMFTE